MREEIQKMVKKLLGVIAPAVFFLAAVAHAQPTPPVGGTGTGGTPPVGGTGVGTPIPSFLGSCSSGGPGSSDVVCILNRIFNAISIIAIPILGTMIIIGGIQLMVSQGNAEAITKGKKTITYAIIGLIAVLLASSVYPIIKSIFS